MRLLPTLLSGALLVCSSAAHGAIIPTLSTITSNGPDFTFTYDATLAPDAGLVSGNRLVLFDFDGYVANSISSPYAFFTASTELVTTGLLSPPGEVDDPTKFNLVFTYTGAAYHAASGPYGPTDYLGFSARSIYGGQTADTFAALTIKNNPNNRPGGTGTPIYTAGYVTVPSPIPEPLTWSMMIVGLGGAGALQRRRRVTGSFPA